MATIPVYSPTVPFLGLIPGGLRPGSMVRIKGVINNHGERCQINIQTGAALNPRDDVPLHLSIRPNEGAIVRNTLQNQIWGTEERYGGCPIHYGQQFDVLVLVEVNQYKIAVNGTHFCTFNHRLPVHTVRFVSISGNCSIHSITSETDGTGGSHTGGIAPPYPGIVPGIPRPPPPYTPPIGGIGFVPVPPPMPPPPPYTPSPGFPTGHYQGGPSHGGFYPHPSTGYPPATPFSQITSATVPSQSGSGSIYPSLSAVDIYPNPQAKPKTMKQTLADGVQQTKDFMNDMLGRTTSTPSYPTQPQPMNVHVSHNPSAPAYPGVTPMTASTHAYPSPGGYPSAPPAVPGSGVGLAATSIATGTAAAVLANLPVRDDIRKQKISKYH